MEKPMYAARSMQKAIWSKKKNPSLERLVDRCMDHIMNENEKKLYLEKLTFDIKGLNGRRKKLCLFHEQPVMLRFINETKTPINNEDVLRIGFIKNKRKYDAIIKPNEEIVLELGQFSNLDGIWVKPNIGCFTTLSVYMYFRL